MSSRTQLDYLPLDILMEVLIRVPQKTAKSMRAVSRCWNSIISSPEYATRLFSIHPSSKDHQLLFRLYGGCFYWSLPLEAGPVVFNRPCFDLSYLEFGCNPSSILDTSEDMILIWSLFADVLFVCNPFTKKRVAIPSLDGPIQNFALVCEPGQGQRYRVVNYKYQGDHWVFSVFVSETGRWNSVNATVKLKFCYRVSYRGKLYWCNDKSIAVYDPFEDTSTLISFPLHKCRDDSIYTCYWLGVVKGSLTLCKFDYDGPERAIAMQFCYLAIWEFDDELGRWNFKKMSSFRKPRQTVCVQMVALDPTEDVAYLTTDFSFGLHDFSEGCDNFSEIALPKKVVRTQRLHHRINTVLLTRSWWPTPVRYGSH